MAPRFGRGCRAFAVQEQGAIVAYGWLSTGPEWVGEVSAQITPAAGEAYIWNCVTLPEHRRRGHYRALLEGILARARSEGLTRMWIGSVDDPAEKANVDVGFVAVVSMNLRRLAGLRRVIVLPVPGADPDLVTAARRRMGERWWNLVVPMRHRIH